MNKIFYTLIFILSLSFFNNEAKAQTSADVSPCTKNASGAVVITSQISSTTDQTCDTSGTTNLTLNVYSLGFCTSAPTVKFVATGKAADERDSSGSYSEGASDFSSCTWTIKQSSASPESLQSVGDIEPLASDEMPPPGTYTHAVLVISNEMTITGSVNFSQTIRDTTTGANTGTTCWTNGTYFVDTGKEGPLIGTSVSNASTNKTGAAPLSNSVFAGGATCGSTASPTANTIVSYYANYEPSSGDCSSGGGCNTTRSEESTAFGNLTVLYTKADLASLATNNPDIRRSKIVTTSNGTATDTNTLTGIFAYNTPMVVTDKTTGMEIYVNFNNALSVDFEPSRRNGELGWTNTLAVTNNASPAAPPRIRAIQSGPFGIQFKPVEGGGIN